jgi:hypothetical protein
MQMAERQQINPMITTPTRDLLRQACQDRKCSQGDLVEAALLAFLTPTEPQAQEAVILKRLLDIEEVLGQVVGVLKQLLALQEELRPKPAPPPIATYEQMYGPITAEETLHGSGRDATLAHSLDHAPEPGPAPGPAHRSRLWRWLVREEES